MLIQQKCGLITFDHLYKLCSDLAFFKTEEIIIARNLIGQYVKKRIPMRQGSDIRRTTVEDLMKTCLDPSNKLPTFFAVDLSRLPPVDVEHCDVSAILRELQVLRSEVRELVKIRTEIEALKSNITSGALIDVQNLEHEVTYCKAELSNFVRKSDIADLKREIIAELQQSTSNIGARSSLVEIPANVGQQVSVVPLTAQRPSYASHARQLGDVGMKDTSRLGRKQVVGQSTKYKLSSVDTRRSVELFVTRFDSHTACGEVTECVSDILRGHPTDQIACIYPLKVLTRMLCFISRHC